MWRRTTISLLSFAGMGVALPMAAAATPATTSASRPAPSDIRPAQADVYVPDSSAAMDQLTLVDQMAARGQWDTACSLAQEVMTKYADKVAPGRLNQEGKAAGYVGMVEAVRQRIARWPAEGRRAYRNHYEPAAHRLLQSAGREMDRLQSIARQYLQTPSGRQAAMRWMDLRLDRGELTAAAWMGGQLLRWDVDLPDAQRGAVLYRMAWAEHLSGRKEDAQRLLKQLNDMTPPSTGIIGGKTVNLAQSLRRALDGKVALSPANQIDWPTMGGGDDRAGVASDVPSIGSRQYSIPLPPVLVVPRSGELPPAQAQLTIEPAVADGQLFFQDGERLYAADLAGSMMIDGWSATYPDRNGHFKLPGQGQTFPTGLSTVTIAPDAVYAVMGGGVARPGRFDRRRKQGSRTSLVCLDRRTGRPKWIVSPDDLTQDLSAKSIEFSGSPIVLGSNVYVLGRGDTGTFQSCYALCLDAQTGEMRWARYVAGSAGAGGAPFGMDFTGVMPQSQPALSQGVLYVSTDNGVVAGLDAVTGDPRWLSLYPHEATRPDFRQLGQSAANELQRPWTANPIVVSGGHLFALPADADQLLIYDAADGRELRRIARSRFGDADTLLGVWDDWVILTGRHRAWAVNWKSYDSKAKEDDGAILRSADLSPIRGRGVITSDAIYIPTERQLKRIALGGDLPARGLMVVENYPPYDRSWPKSEGPGNVIVAEDRLIVAGADGVNIYADWNRLRGRMEQAIHQAPDDPRPRLRFARALIAAGQAKEGLSQIDRAIDLLKQTEVEEDSSPSLFNTLETMAHRATQWGDVAAAGELYDRAAGAVRTPSDQVAYLFGRAALAHRQKAWPREIQLLRAILTDPDLRVIPTQTPDEDGQTGVQTQAAGEAAAAQIAELIKTPEVLQAYAPIQRQAKAQFDQARGRQDPDALLGVARNFPNAAVAGEARLAAARVYEDRRNWADARRILRRMLVQDAAARGGASDSPSLTEAVRDAKAKPSASALDAAHRTRLLEALARIDLHLNRPLNAWARLIGAARLDSNGRLHETITAADGVVLEKNLGYADAARALIAKASLPAARLPAFKPITQEHPFAIDASAAIKDVSALIQPLPDHERFDRVVGWSRQGRVLLIRPGDSKPPAVIDMRSQPQGCAWVGIHLLLWNDAQLLSVDGTTGKPLWRWSIDTLRKDPAIDAPLVADAAGARRVHANPRRPRLVIRNGPGMRAGILPDMPTLSPAPVDRGPPTIDHVRPSGRNILLTTSDGRLICLNADDSSLAWQRRPGRRPIQRLLVGDDFAAVRLVEAGLQALVVYEVEDGRIIFNRTFDESAGQSLMNAALGPQGVLVYTTRQGLEGKDLYQEGNQPTFRSSPRHSGSARVLQGVNASHMGMIRPDQLILHGNRILALGDLGRFVRVHSLKDGRLIQHHDARHNRDVPAILSTGAQGWEISLHTADDRLYVLSPKTLVCYGLPPAFNPTEQWRWKAVQDSHFNQLIIGQSFLSLIGRPANHPAMIDCFSRRRVKDNRESGLLQISVPLPHGSDWTAVDGGFYYIDQETARYWKGG